MSLQPSFFDPPPPPPGDGRVRFGTSSFSSADWVGPFYPRGTRPADFLRYYATQFDTVEIDATYYAEPAPATAAAWARKTPETFCIAAKFPRAIVHGGDGARPDPARVLDPDATYPVRDRFLDAMRRLGPRCGPLLLQFPRFGAGAFPTLEAFLERLVPFLDDLPGDFRYALEVRNPDWLAPILYDACRTRRVAVALVDRAGMPHGDAQLAAHGDAVTADFAYVRLLGDRQAIEKITRTWDREVIDHGERLQRWARVLVRLRERVDRIVVYANNHYAGHGPATIRRLMRAYDAALGEGADAP